MSEIISREAVCGVLTDWVEQRLDEVAMWHWAQDMRQRAEPSDELVRDIVDALSTLPYDLIVVDDAQVMLDALANPSQEIDLSINLLWNHLDSIAGLGRETEYAQHPFYGPYIDR